MALFRMDLQQIIHDRFEAANATTQPRRVETQTVVTAAQFGNHTDAQSLYASYEPVRQQLYTSLMALYSQLNEMHALFGMTVTSFDDLERNITRILSQLAEPPGGAVI